MQNTIKKSVNLSGIGLHTGVEAEVMLKPLEAGQGVQFVRSDKKNGLIPLKPEVVVETNLCTKIANEEGVLAQTIEHLFAALHGMGIDNIRIELDGPEVPILDGSALPWVELLEKAGIEKQTCEKNFFYAPTKIFELANSSTASVEANSDALKISVEASFPVQGLEKMQATWQITPEVFKKEIAPARTFCLKRDVDRLLEAGLIKGGTLDCAVVFDDNGQPVNPEGLRFSDEPLRHKVLDVIGDLFLLGRPIRGNFSIPTPGHGTNNQILRQITNH
ncbi:MAG: UDP-3-O-acyl-N-acetylglucosamine deacetylase [Alphaproteobacteria bacterium]|nr:UDP-3-O-acyl-N-acetylglucosamine deacetylase [Alphaproteobacteria bacterium]